MYEGEIVRLTYAALAGVGDAGLGEWAWWGDVGFHVRRRLTEREQAYVGEAVDIRGSDEARARIRRVRQWLPNGYPLDRDPDGPPPSLAEFVAAMTGATQQHA